jgi:hypothetical protein
MKTIKYKIFGHHIALFAVLLGGFFVLPHHAFASAPPQVNLGADFNFIDSQHIEGTLNGKPVIFYDQNPGDSNHNYAPQDLDSDTYCNPTKYWGINLPKDVNLSAKSVSGAITLGYEDTNGNSKTCKAIPGINDKPITVGNSGSAASSGFIWQDTDIVSSDGNDTYTATPTNTNNGKVFINNSSAGTCDQSGVIITDGPSSGTLYELGTAAGGRAPATGTAVPDPPASYLSGTCHLLDTKKISIAGAQGTTPPTAAGSQSGGQSSNNTGSCESGFVSAFSWIVCPSLSLIDGIINAAYGQVENQLCFNTGPTSSTGGVVCDTTDSLGDGVKTSWNIFKNIASALLVIVMLVMVISQAIGGGPFDAYTVRKMLPKLVAAVIIMQLSYVLLRYAIDLSNDAGKAIGQLIMAPFGGPENMNLGDMIGRAASTAAGDKSSVGGFITQSGFDVFASIAAIGAFYYAIPALPLLGLYVLLGVFIAFFVLVLRKLLIIMLVILSPLAFIAWVMPGTERYWKMWRENITKLLVMFPLVMAMLASGRVFAYITSKAGNGASMFNPHLALAHLGPMPVPYIASATGFANLAIIIIAYFAPYFLLPKTFSWGGQLLGAAGKQVENYTNKGAEPAKKFLKSREESYRGERRRRSQERFKDEIPFKWNRPWQRPMDLLRAGKLDPTLGARNSRRREEAMTAYKAAGAESEKKETDAANAAAQLTIERIHPDEQDAYARALAAGQVVRIGEDGRIKANRYNAGDIITNPDGTTRVAQGGELRVNEDGTIERAEGAKRSTLVQMRAGLDQMARLGGEGNIDYIQRAFIRAMNSGNPEQIEMMNKFTTANVQSLFTKLPHMYKNNNFGVTGHREEHDVVRTVEGFKPEDITALSGIGMKTLRNNLLIRASDMTIDQSERDKSQAALARLTATFQQAAADPTLRGRIPADVARAMSDLANNRNLPEPVNANWGLGSTLQDINSRVSPQGIVRDPSGAQGQAGAPGAQGQAGAQGAQGPAGAPGRPAPGQGAFIPNGEINVPHNSPEGQIISANVGDIDNYVQSVGGWQNIPDGELMNIYHFRTGQHKAEAARQLRNRNLL